MKEFIVSYHYEGLNGQTAYREVVPAMNQKEVQTAVHKYLENTKFVQTETGMFPASRIIKVHIMEGSK
jgi:hypothetical protein